METGRALMVRVAARSGRPGPGVPPGTPPPSVDKAKVGLLISTDIGRSLVPVKDEIDLPVLMQALRTSLAGGKTLLSDAEADAVSQSFGARAEAKQKAAAAEAAIRNAADGAHLLAENKSLKGVLPPARQNGV